MKEQSATPLPNGLISVFSQYRKGRKEERNETLSSRQITTSWMRNFLQQKIVNERKEKEKKKKERKKGQRENKRSRLWGKERES